jgi:hypothetical protein
VFCFVLFCFVFWPCINLPNYGAPHYTFGTIKKPLIIWCAWLLVAIFGSTKQKFLNFEFFSFWKLILKFQMIFHHWIFWKVMSLRALKKFALNSLFMLHLFIGFFTIAFFHKIVSVKAWKMFFCEKFYSLILWEVCLRIS